MREVMSAEDFDSIIVGARCAGAPLATLLARAGQKVLLLDAATLPSDQPLSTHFITPIGVEWLDELGVGAEVRRLSPPSSVMRLEMDGVAVHVPYRRGRAGHCLRRFKLDGLLQEAAVGAGAVLRDRTKVVGLVRERDRVVGVDAISDGSRHTYRARVVVGADGRNSSVAELAGAKEYLGYDNPRFGYWAYWPAKAVWRTDADLKSFDAYVGFAADHTVRFVFQADGDLLLIGALALLTELPSWRGNYEAAYIAALQTCPVTAALIGDNERHGEIVGLLKARYFFREAAGPGFALVGDAGLHKDPTPGWGITDALRDARNLACAIIVGTDAALVRYWRKRDVDSIELFHFASDMGSPGYMNPFNRLVYERVRRSPALGDRLAAIVDREVSPYAAVPSRNVLGWVAGAALRGKISVVRGFLSSGKRGKQVERDRRERVALLEGLPARS
jgi:flavin-dependent dehydrogenase